MATESNKYVNLWEKYKPVIVSKMKSLACNGLSFYPLSEHEFKAVGDRDSAGYQFFIQITNGRVVNNLSGSAVARDLKQVLLKSNTVDSLIRVKNYHIRMDQKFVLHIECTGNIE